MKVSAKGQVTIPVEIRRRLGILPGSEVEFKIEDGTARLIPVQTPHSHGEGIVEHLRGKGSVEMTTDEIMALTRE